MIQTRTISRPSYAIQPTAWKVNSQKFACTPVRYGRISEDHRVELVVAKIVKVSA